MNALRFTAGGRELAGVLHPGGTKTGVLICSPFGQEAVRVQRLLRVMAERLSLQGHAVLRFDWFATGDSMGEDADGEMLGWQDDLLAADALLRARAGCTQVVWLGIRLGASIASVAAARSGDAPRALILWEPVIDGADYLRRLRADHERALIGSYGPLRRDPAIDHGPAEQALGFELGRALCHQLKAFLLPAPKPGLPVLVLAPPGHRALVWPVMPTRDVRQRVLSHDFDWTAEEAMNTALVPTQALRQVLQGVGELA